ncbi:hypothetical protein ACJJTC_004091 [Scirpophaga incertulas]
MDPQPSTSSESSLSPKKKRPRIALSATEKLMVHNVYKHVYKNKSTTLLPTETPVKKECVSETADMLGIGISTVYSVLEQRKENEQFKPPVKSGRIQWRNYRVASRQNAAGPQPEGAPDQESLNSLSTFIITLNFFFKLGRWEGPSDEFATGLERYSYATGRIHDFKDKLDDFTFSAIRRKVHQFYMANEAPTIAKILKVVNEDPDLPNFSWSNS